MLAAVPRLVLACRATWRGATHRPATSAGRTIAIAFTAVALSVLLAAPARVWAQDTDVRAAELRAIAADPPPPVPGADPVLDSARAIRGRSITVSVITYGPGDAIFEKFGHNALAIRDDAMFFDVAYNWGTFDFDQPNFLGRFFTGNTRYWMLGYRTAEEEVRYRRDNRSIRRQTLALTPVERSALAEFVSWNARDAHKYYQYDYYLDNCSTRVRDALDRVLGGRLKSLMARPGRGTTWRAEAERATASSLPAYAGIQFGLGRNADRVISQWEEGFLPAHLADALTTVSLRSADGVPYRLVTDDTVIFDPDRVPVPAEPPERVFIALLAGLGIAGLIALLADSPARPVRVVFATTAGVWYLVAGVLGTVLLLLATITRNGAYAGHNLSLFEAHPLLLVAAVVVPLALVRGVRTRTATGVAVIIAALSLVGAMLQLVPSLTQHNGVVFALAAPINVALAIAVWRLAPRPGSPATTA